VGSAGRLSAGGITTNRNDRAAGITVGGVIAGGFSTRVVYNRGGLSVTDLHTYLIASFLYSGFDTLVPLQRYAIIGSGGLTFTGGGIFKPEQ